MRVNSILLFTRSVFDTQTFFKEAETVTVRVRCGAMFSHSVSQTVSHFTRSNETETVQVSSQMVLT